MEIPLIDTISLLLRIYQPCNLLWIEAMGECIYPLMGCLDFKGLAVGLFIR